MFLNAVPSAPFPLFPGAYVSETGFVAGRLRWRFPEEINFMGCGLLGLAFGTLTEAQDHVITCHDGSDLAASVASALMMGLTQSGQNIQDCGLCPALPTHFTSPTMYCHSPADGVLSVSLRRNGAAIAQADMDRLQQGICTQDLPVSPGGNYTRQRKIIFA